MRFDHWAEEALRVRWYLRYTDDLCIVHHDPDALRSLLRPMARWLWTERRLKLHSRKIILRKLSQGVDFLGYVTLPRHRVLRTRTKRRMFRRVNVRNLTSYIGVLQHCSGHSLRR